MTANADNYITYNYDAFGRENGSHYSVTGANELAGIWEGKNYLDASPTKTTNMVSQLRQRYSSLSSETSIKPDYTYDFTCDNGGNANTVITTPKSGSAYTSTYSYDNLDQVLGVYNHQNDGYDREFDYDAGGNITNQYIMKNGEYIAADSHTYSGPLDSLSKFVSAPSAASDAEPTITKNYTYDAVGNPTSIATTNSGSTKTRNLTWEQGHQLNPLQKVLL